ncbi:MAG: GNAT family N-acetyltransferase [Anaerolineales bacterium]|nr:GNAT family N-acetyltransferase [Anaerolineales bacterium]MCX7608737.1 GNAT family N-acetyltransferase [Anaerolineales bacterium]MDW8226453.1 GNAT family N-acetyltransferase [Anaerolineales bacterium]
MTDVKIRPVTQADFDEWMRMRLALWDEEPAVMLIAEMKDMLENPLTPVFVAERGNGKLGGFLEGGVRRYAEGCDTSPVAYVEGWYVDPDLRSQRIGRRLMEAMESWAREHGFAELASDTWLENEISQKAHLALGFEECERIITYRKVLGPPKSPAPLGLSLQEWTARIHAFVRSKGWYEPESPRPQTPRNLAISLSLEANEVLEHFQWHDQPQNQDELASELADVALYLLQLASVTKIDLEQAILKKLEMNMERSWD